MLSFAWIPSLAKIAPLQLNQLVLWDFPNKIDLKLETRTKEDKPNGECEPNEYINIAL